MTYLTNTTTPGLNTKQVANGGGANSWAFSGTDADTTVDGSGYITNAKALGMKKGDLVYYTKTDASPVANFIFNVSAINANGSADLSNSTPVTATNGD